MATLVLEVREECVYKLRFEIDDDLADMFDNKRIQAYQLVDMIDPIFADHVSYAATGQKDYPHTFVSVDERDVTQIDVVDHGNPPGFPVPQELQDELRQATLEYEANSPYHQYKAKGYI